MKMFAAANKLTRQPISEGGLQIGIWLNLGSALSLYLATLFLDQGQAVYPVDSQLYLWMRYLLGASICIICLAWIRPWQVTKEARKFVIWRSILNAGAVFCFYKAVEWGEAGQANVLNMTYPVFVVLLAGPILAEWPDRWTVLLVILAVLGIALNFPDVLNRPEILLDFNQDQLLARGMALLSAVVAALAILALRGAARLVSAYRILFWMFLFGALAFAPSQAPELGQTPSEIWIYIGLSAFFGVLGQFLITLSFRFLPAASGSIVSTARIPIALILGVLFLDEPFRPLAYVGAALIAGSNVLLALRSAREKLG